MASRYEVEVLGLYRCEQLRQEAGQVPLRQLLKRGSELGRSLYMKLQVAWLFVWSWLQAMPAH